MQELTQQVIAAQSGDLDAFGALVTRFQDMAYAIAYGMLGDAHLAEDAAQDAFLEAYLCLPKLRDPAAFPGWFRRIVIKRGDRLIRGNQRAPLSLATVGPIASAEPEPSTLAETRELQHLVRDAIAALPASERLATALYYITGYSQPEIADCLNLPVSTIKKRLYNSRQRLRARMEDVVNDHLQRRRPSQDARFARTIQFLIAVRTGDTARVEALLRADPALTGAREELEDGSVKQYYPLQGRYTALHRATAKGYSELVPLLLASGADVNATTGFGETPLHTAALHNRVVEAQLLLAAGANPNPALKNGMSPLHWAAQRGHIELTELLLARGADRTVRDVGGRTPLDWARLKSHQRVIALLADKEGL